MRVELTLQNKKLELIQWLSTIEDYSIIQKILDLRAHENKDWYNTVSDAEKQSIEKGLSDADSGKLTPHSDARKLYDKWL